MKTKISHMNKQIMARVEPGEEKEVVGELGNF